MDALLRSEFDHLRSWSLKNAAIFPEEIRKTQERLLTSYHDLLENRAKSLQNLKLLRQAMGFIPKSEKGSQEKHGVAICKQWGA